MEKNIKDIIANIAETRQDVYKYITETEHWLFYWINNKEVQQFIEENPDDYEDLVSIEIEDMDTSCSCKIIFEDHPNEVESITRFCVLPTFRDAVKTNWLRWNGRVKEMKLEELNKQLESYKNMVGETEEKIRVLLGEKVGNENSDGPKLGSVQKIINFVLNVANWQVINKGFYHKMSLHLQDIIPGFVIEWIVVDNGVLSFDGEFIDEKGQFVKDGTMPLSKINPVYLDKILETLKNIDMFRS
mgnify:CR=1 FL=1